MPNATESPLEDLTYDVITILHAKAKALEAYEEYLRDAEEDEELHALFERIRRDDEEHVRVLKEALARRLDEELGYEEEEDYKDYDEEDVVESPDEGGPPPARGESTHRRV